MSYKIGKVVGVENGALSIALLDYGTDADGNEFGVHENMTIDLQTDGGPQPLLIGQPSSFIEVSLPVGRLLCTVTSIKMTEESALASEIRNLESGTFAVLSKQRMITALPIGTFGPDGQFERGTDILPTVGNFVFAVSPEKIRSVYRSASERDFSVGVLSILPDERAYIDVNTFIGRHGAILGQTGGGKSWTVASILQKIQKFDNATVILLDLHGEYKDAFGPDVDYLSISDIELPYWLMNFEELIGLCIDRGEREAPNQIAKFREILQNAKERAAANEELDLPKITLDTPIYFDFNDVINSLKEIDTEMVQGNRGLKQGPFFGQFTRMLTRVESRLNDTRYDLIFRPSNYVSSASLTNLMKKILGEEDEPKKTVILDISPIPFDVRASVISLLLRVAFDFAYWHRRALQKEYPIYVVCDEAHIYLNDKESSQIPARLAAERIAKEGRKYGVGLLVISQRPRELSSTILSQCNTFVCMRVSNPDDQSYIKGLLPDSLRGIVDVFATLRRGEALFLGESVMMPTRIKIDLPYPTPNSNDVKFSEIWNSPREEIDFNSVLDEWRRQGVPRVPEE
jgi:DNA helicase HerA-like ATPase